MWPTARDSSRCRCRAHLLQQAATCSFADLDDLVEAAISAVVRIWNLCGFSCSWIEATKELHLLLRLRGWREVEQIALVVGVHRAHQIELFEITAHERPSAMPNFIPTPFGGGSRTCIGQFTHVIIGSASPIDQKLRFECSVLHQLAEHSLRSGRAADVSKAHETNAEHS